MPDRCTVGAVAVLLVILFAGCSRHEPAAITVRADGRVLNLYSWAEYFPADVLHQFEAETGIKVNYAVFDSNDVAETTLSAGHSGFDLVTVNVAPHLGRQIPKGLWQPLDRTQLATLRGRQLQGGRCQIRHAGFDGPGLAALLARRGRHAT